MKKDPGRQKRSWTSKKLPCLRGREAFSAVAVEHHAAVCAGGVGTDEVVPGILVCHDGLLHVLHRVE